MKHILLIAALLCAGCGTLSIDQQIDLTQRQINGAEHMYRLDLDQIQLHTISAQEWRHTMQVKQRDLEALQVQRVIENSGK